MDYCSISTYCGLLLNIYLLWTTAQYLLIVDYCSISTYCGLLLNIYLLLTTAQYLLIVDYCSRFIEIAAYLLIVDYCSRIIEIVAYLLIVDYCSRIIEIAAYLLFVDYCSRFIEIARLNRTTAEEVINHTKSIFARHRIPKVVVSDNGPQCSAEVYAEFAQEYQFMHITSSPYYVQSNREAVGAVGPVKQLLKKESDPYLALLAYRSSPLQSKFYPSELLISCTLHTYHLSYNKESAYTINSR